MANQVLTDVGLNTQPLRNFIDENINKYESSEIVGLSPTARFFEDMSLECASTLRIGLNESFVFAKVDVLISIHPEVVYKHIDHISKLPNKLIFGKEKFLGFITSLEKDESDASRIVLEALLSRKIYLFSYRLNPSKSLPFDPSTSGRNAFLFQLENNKHNYLYAWSSISQTAMHLSERIAVKKIFLYGCESISYGDSVKSAGHARWMGVSPKYRLSQYAQGNREVAGFLHAKGVTVSTVVPFSSLNSLDSEYKQSASLRILEPPASDKKLDTSLSKQALLKERVNSVLFFLSKVLGYQATLGLYKAFIRMVKKGSMLCVLMTSSLALPFFSRRVVHGGYRFSEIKHLILSGISKSDISDKDFSYVSNRSGLKLGDDILVYDFNIDGNKVNQDRIVVKVLFLKEGKGALSGLSFLKKFILRVVRRNNPYTFFYEKGGKLFIISSE